MHPAVAVAVAVVAATTAAPDIVWLIVAVAALVVVGAIVVTVVRAQRLSRASDSAAELKLQLDLAAIKGVRLTAGADPDADPSAAPSDSTPPHDVAPAARVTSRHTVAERLARLDDLHAQGLISDDEKAAARTKVLGDL